MPGSAYDPVPTPRSPFAATLPLIVLTSCLFVGSYLTYESYPKLGPDQFPLWGLLVTLGFIAAIGAVVSGFFAVDGPSVPDGVGNPARVDATSAARGSPAEFGRPVPERSARRLARGAVSRSSASTGASRAEPKVWDEATLPPVVARGPRPVLTTPDDPGEIGRALRRIGEIQRDLTRRRGTPTATVEPPTRA